MEGEEGWNGREKGKREEQEKRERKGKKGKGRTGGKGRNGVGRRGIKGKFTTNLLLELNQFLHYMLYYLSSRRQVFKEHNYFVCYLLFSILYFFFTSNIFRADKGT